MGQNIQKRWFSGSLVAGLMAASVFSGFAGMDEQAVLTAGREQAVEAYARAYPVRKSDFHLTEYITEGVAALMAEDVTGSAIQTRKTVEAGGSQQSNGTVTAGVGQNPQSGAGQGGSGTVTAGQDHTTNGTVTAGQGQNGQQTSGTVTAGGQGSNQSSASSQQPAGTVTAGGSRQSVGPSVQTSIVTEGEKGILADPILGGATLTMLNSQTDSQILSAILQTSQGKLIVIDGGLGEDGEYLLSQIQARGGHVAAWLITHPHGDHVGALYKILQAGAPGIQIDGIYYSFAAPEWYAVHDPGEQTMASSIIGTFAGLPQNLLHQVSRNQFIQVDDVVIQVMNDRYELSEDKGNNASIVYKMLVNGKKLLFLGDMSEAGGRRLLAECGADNLKADIVQMAHHGQNGVGEEVYKAVSPSICLWPTPQWLWTNSGNRWKIPETKSWMTRLNVQRHYVMKDGDQMIR